MFFFLISLRSFTALLRNSHSNERLIRCFTVYLTVTNNSASSCQSWQPLVKMTVLRLRTALAPFAALPLVIVRSWNVLASLQMASVNAADRGITIFHNFWLPMADARCQTLKRSSYHLSLFPVAATDLDAEHPHSRNSPKSLMVALSASCHVSKTSRGIVRVPPNHSNFCVII